MPTLPTQTARHWCISQRYEQTALLESTGVEIFLMLEIQIITAVVYVTCTSRLLLISVNRNTELLSLSKSGQR